jgi:ribosome-binding factor A
LTPDLRFAQIFYSVYGSDEQWERTQEGLVHAVPFIRRLIGERIQLRYVPEIIFKSDHSAEYSIRVEEQLQAIKVVEEGPRKKRKVSDGSKKSVRRVAKKRK